MNKHLTELQIKLLLELENHLNTNFFSEELNKSKESLHIVDVLNLLIGWSSNITNYKQKFVYEIKVDEECFYSGILYNKVLDSSFPQLESIYPSLYNCQGLNGFYDIIEPIKIFTENVYEVYHLLLYTFFHSIFSYISIEKSKIKLTLKKV